MDASRRSGAWRPWRLIMILLMMTGALAPLAVAADHDGT